MNVEITVRVDGREVASLSEVVFTVEALPMEEQVEGVKNRVGCVLMEVGAGELAAGLRHPCCCGRRMENKGRRCVTLTCQSGEFTLERNRYRCRACRRWLMPADAVLCCGRHRVTRLLAKSVCQLATLEHFTRLEQLLADQHGVHLGHDSMMQLAHDVGGAAEAQRLAEAENWLNQPREQRTWPEPEITPHRVYVSCDGIMYCTNQTEPDPQRPGQQRLIWRQMRVGCVSWQDPQEHWHKRVIWGQEEDFQSFGASLYRLACRCGYRQAEEKIFAADGGDRRGGLFGNQSLARSTVSTFDPVARLSGRAGAGQSISSTSRTPRAFLTGTTPMSTSGRPATRCSPTVKERSPGPSRPRRCCMKRGEPPWSAGCEPNARADEVPSAKRLMVCSATCNRSWTGRTIPVTGTAAGRSERG